MQMWKSMSSPKMLCTTAVMKAPSLHKRGTVLSSITIIAQCTALLLRTGHHHEKHVVGKHLRWQSKNELTQLFSPFLILDGILRVTEKNILARNGDNSAWGEQTAQRALLDNTWKCHLIILFHTTLASPTKNARGENMSSRAFHPPISPSHPI